MGTNDNQQLLAFWDKMFGNSLKEMNKQEEQQVKPLEEIAPSKKLFTAAASLGQRQHVLDYGCGSGWAGIIAAHSGCPHVTAVDPSENAVKAARERMRFYGVEDKIQAFSIQPDWISTVPNGTFDGFFCSNVLDVIPPQTAEEILREAARIVTEDAPVIIGMNYYLSPEAAAKKGTELIEGRMVYMDGVLRLVSRSDEEWSDIFSSYYKVEKIEHFAWPGEKTETRRIFFLRKLQ